MESTKNPQMNKMAAAPVNRLMLSMGIPMIISMMLQAVYNIVDSAFVSNMAEGGEQALNALTLAFPVQMLMVAIAIGTGVGMNALMSRSLGQGDRELAGKAAGNAIFLAAVIYVVFLLFGIFGTGAYVGSQTKNAEIAEMAEEYIRICCTLSFGIIFFSVFEKTLQASGRSLFSTIAQVAGAVTNIVLDPIMIYGLRDAITPIVSFGYGMGSRERVKQGIKYGMLYTLIIMAAGLVLLEIFAQPFAALFGLSGETEQLCVSAMRVISLSFIFAGANVAFQGIFQALESGVQSLVISVCRQILFVLPVAWGFSLIVRNSGSTDMMWLVWLTFLIAEGLSAVIAVILMTGISRRRISTLGN